MSHSDKNEHAPIRLFTAVVGFNLRNICPDGPNQRFRFASGISLPSLRPPAANKCQRLEQETGILLPPERLEAIQTVREKKEFC